LKKIEKFLKIKKFSKKYFFDKNLHVVVVDCFYSLDVDFARSRLEIDSCGSKSAVEIPLARICRAVTLAAPNDDFAFELSGKEAHSRMLDASSFVPRRAQVLFLPNAVASWSAFDVANGSAFSKVGDWSLVAVVDRLVDAGIRRFRVWAVFFQLIRVTKRG